jgi:hypothetical protein
MNYRLAAQRFRVDQDPIALRLLPAVHDRLQQRRVHPSQPSQQLRIHPVALRVVLRDQPHPPRVRDDRLVAQPRHRSAHPGRVRPHLQHHPARCEARQPGRQRRLRRPHPKRLHDLARLVEHPALGESVPEIQADRQPAIPRDTLAHASLLFGTHFGGEPALFADLHGTAFRRLAFSSHLVSQRDDHTAPRPAARAPTLCVHQPDVEASSGGPGAY